LVGRGHVVRGEEDRRTAVPLSPNEVLDPLRVHRVESAGRFVEKNQVRVVQNTAGDAQTALHALRVLANTPVAVALEADRFEHCGGSASRAAVQRPKIPQVLEAGELEEVVGSFEGDPDPLVVVGGPGRYLLVAHAHEPAVSFEEADQNFLGRGLTGAAWPKETEDLAAFDGKRQSTHGRFVRARVGEMEVANVDHAFREAFRNGLYPSPLAANLITRLGVSELTATLRVESEAVRAEQDGAKMLAAAFYKVEQRFASLHQTCRRQVEVVHIKQHGAHPCR
jgi:hypothetical protein